MLAFSCTMSEIDTQMTAEQAIAAIRLECSAESAYTVSAEKAQVITFKVFSTTPWKITGHEDQSSWLTLTPASSDVSSLSEDIQVSIALNEAYAGREATLTLSGKNTDITRTIAIKQLPKGRFNLQPVTADIPASGGSVSFTFTSNLDWTVVSDKDWLSFDTPEGQGEDGVAKTIKAMASSNPSISRTAKVTVTSGEFKESFMVTQEGGISLDFNLEGDALVPSQGGNLLIGVNADMDWTAEIEEPFTATKVGKNSLRVSAPWNNIFKDRTATLTIKPIADTYGDISRSIEVTQECNFTFEGDCIVMDDGSVRLGSSGGTTRVVTKDTFRYVSVVLTMGETNFGEHPQFCLSTHDAMIPETEAPKFEMQCQIILREEDPKSRLRTNGGKDEGHDTYDSKDFNITVDELKALTEYRVDFLPASANKLHLEFFYNGKSKAVLEGSKPAGFAYDDQVAGHYFFGFETSPYDNTWYIVKTCDITPVAED